jgi:cell wall-associated NlpC family hydrolase
MMNYDNLIGVPFVNHGRDAHKGFDCYGLVMEVYRRNGKHIPEYNADYNDAEKISGIIHKAAKTQTWRACHPPNLPVPCLIAIRMGTAPGVVNHTGVYIGNEKFIHIREKTGVCIDRINSPAWRGVIAGFYEFVGDK